MKRSKKYQDVSTLVDKNKSYSIDEAIELLPKVNFSKFDASVELHVNLLLSEKQKKETIRISTTLPNVLDSQTKKIAVITSTEHADKAKGADIVGSEDLIKKIQEGFSEFDVVIATPDMMPKVAVLGKVLGPKGKMPNPKNGTVTLKLKETIDSYKKGKVDIRVDKQGGIHQKLGKISMDKKSLKQNIVSILKSIYQETKRFHVIPFQSVFLSPTMGPSIKIDTNEIIKELT